MDARGWGALTWTHKRFLPLLRTECSWMLVDGVISHGPMSDSYLQRTGCSRTLVDGVLSHGPMSGSYLCNAQDARECAWMECYPMGP